LTNDLSYDKFGEKREVTATPIQVKRFLREFKMAAGKGNGICYGQREKNWNTLVNLNMTTSMRNDCVLGLTWRNYCQSPMDDNGSESGDVWVFGVKEGKHEIYIKLKFANSIPVCISFHCAEHHMIYPFGEKNV
jgi:hypothetical protein